MLLKDIKEPKQLKALSISELEDLCQQIREYLIETVSKTGGHLSSNLGAVELTVALHYVFDSPIDKIFFDVGHQCYTHKLLTGRYEEFKNLRTYGGIAGFEKRCESKHDVWEAGHSSTSLSAALGMAISRDLNHEDYSIVPVIGDGALTGGMALEALDQIGATKHKMVIVFNDNDMSISKNVGAINNILEQLRESKGYNDSKKVVKGILSGNPIGSAISDEISKLKTNIKNRILDTNMFGKMGFEYYGPVNGHNLKDLIQVFKLAKEELIPTVVHIQTIKGKGYLPCENDTQGYWHGVGSFDPKTGKSLSVLPPDHKNWSFVVSEALVNLAKENRDICAITPAMITGSKLEKFFKMFPDRSFDCGIAEEHATTFAAGLAISGKRPFISLYSSFLQRAYDQINHDICRMDLPVVIGIDRAQLDGEDGDTHHGVFDIGLLQPLPNMIIAQGKDCQETQNLLYTAFNQNHPFALRYPKGSISFTNVVKFENIEIGKWDIFNNNSPDAFIITYGPEVDRLYQKMKINELNIAIVNARYIKPLDKDMLNDIAQYNKPIFTYEIDMLKGGLGSSIIEYYNDNKINVNIQRFGIDDRYVTFGSNNALKKELKLDINTVCELIIDSVYKKS